MDDGGGRQFREAWIEGVRRHYPGEPKPGYVAPWEEMPSWEQESAAAVHGQVVAFLAASRRVLGGPDLPALLRSQGLLRGRLGGSAGLAAGN